MTVAVAKPRRNARRFDKLDIEVATVLAAMKRAEALHLEFARRGRFWRSNRGGRIADEGLEIQLFR